VPNWASLDNEDLPSSCLPSLIWSRVVLWTNRILDIRLQDHSGQVCPIKSAPKQTYYLAVTDREQEKHQNLKSTDRGLKHCTRRHGNQIQIPLLANSWIKFEQSRTGRIKIFSLPVTTSGHSSVGSFKALFWFTWEGRVEKKSSPFCREPVTTKLFGMLPSNPHSPSYFMSWVWFSTHQGNDRPLNVT